MVAASAGEPAKVIDEEKGKWSLPPLGRRETDALHVAHRDELWTGGVPQAAAMNQRAHRAYRALLKPIVGSVPIVFLGVGDPVGSSSPKTDIP